MTLEQAETEVDETFRLGVLAEPSAFHEPVDLRRRAGSFAVDSLGSMMLIRAVENRLARARRDGLIGGPVHLGVGQEAVAVGVS